MKRKKIFFVLALVVLWIVGPRATATAKTASPGAAFSPQYRDWLDKEVVYIISPVERKVFLQLQSDRERDLLITAFWKHRDPTPETEENEFKTEHYRRLQHVNHVYGRSAPMPGWRTDRGRTYIILGEPLSIMNFENKPGLYPAEIWYYQGLTRLGLPEGLNLIFFQEGGTGDFKLYSPARDGPMSLLMNFRGTPSDYDTAYSNVYDVDPALANASLSVIPGDSSVSMSRPSTSSDVLLQKISDVPWVKIEDQYARKFLQYKDRVEVEYSANYIASNAQVCVQQDDSGIARIHYAIEFKNLALDTYENTFYTALKISGSVSTPEGKLIYQFDKLVSLKLDEAQLQDIRVQPFNYRDLFPLIPGRYQLSVLVKNEVSKEFTSIERALVIPEKAIGPQITPLLLGYRASTPAADNGKLKPFQFGPFQINSQPGAMFVRKETMAAVFQVSGLNEMQKAGAVLRWSIVRDDKPLREITRPLGEYASFPDCLENIPLAELDPAFYTLTVSLLADGRELAAASEEFAVSPLMALPRPWFYSRSLPAANDPQYIQVIGSQFFNSGQFSQAKIWLEKAFALKPDGADIAQNLAQVYLAVGETQKVIPLLTPFLTDEKKAGYEMYLLHAQALQKTGEYAKAVEIYIQTISRFGVNTMLLNAIGGCYLKMERLQDALGAWEKSLQLDPGQAEIRKQVETLKRKE